MITNIILLIIAIFFLIEDHTDINKKDDLSELKTAYTSVINDIKEAQLFIADDINNLKNYLVFTNNDIKKPSSLTLELYKTVKDSYNYRKTHDFSIFLSKFTIKTDIEHLIIGDIYQLKDKRIEFIIVGINKIGYYGEAICVPHNSRITEQDIKPGTQFHKYKYKYK